MTSNPSGTEPAWVAVWEQIFGMRPSAPAFREVSTQDVLAGLVVGRVPAYFEACTPTPAGTRFLASLWGACFDDGPTHLDWFVSEYALPVPPYLRSDIPFTYRCPDYAVAGGDRLLIIELKTEIGSYERSQPGDYLTLARELHPSASIDLVLLGPKVPRYTPSIGPRQRYAELTWKEVPPLLADAFGNDDVAERLSRFINESLQPHPTAAAQQPLDRDLVVSAVTYALHLAPTVAAARPGDRIERGIDIAFGTEALARTAQTAIANALESNGYAENVTVWLWQPGSGGMATTPAGKRFDRELRLAPRSRRT